MNDEHVPTVTVETDGVSITVTDARTAEAAMPFIMGTLEHYLGGAERTYGGYQPVDVVCDSCGHEWTYEGKSAKKATCPECQRHVAVDAMTEDRL